MLRLWNRWRRSLTVGLLLLVAVGAVAGGAMRGEGRSDAEPGQPSEAALEATANGKEKGKEIHARDDWFYSQRAFPSERIPPGALKKAREEGDKLKKAKKHAFSVRTAVAAPSSSGGSGAALTSFAASTAAATITWSAIGPHPVLTPGDLYQGAGPVSGRVTAIAPVSATTAYLGGAAGGVWKTTDGGVTWTPVFDGQPSLAIGSITIDPASSSIIWVGTGEGNQSADSYFGQGLFKSTDAGATWTKMGGTTFDNCRVTDVAPLGASTVFVAAQSGGASTPCTRGIYRSTDGGATFTRLITGSGMDLSVNGTTVYAGLNGALFKSPDAGATWVRLDGTGTTTGLPTASIGRVAVAVAPSDANRVYAAYESSATNDLLGIYTSANGGATWSSVGAFDTEFCNVGGGGQCWYDLALAVSPADPSSFYAAGIKLYKSTTGGATMLGPIAYGGTGIHVDFHAVAYDPSGNVWVGNDGGAYRVAPGGTVANLNNDLQLSEFEPGLSGSVATGSKLLGGLQDNGSLQYAGAGWNQVFGGDGGASAIDPATNTRYVSYVYGAIYKSVAGGAFASATSGINGADPVQFYAPLIMSPTTRSTLYMGTNKVYRTTNSAGSWSAISPQLPVGTNASVTAIGPAASDSSTVYAGTSDGQIKITTNGGTTWSANGTGIPSRFVTDVEVDPTTASAAYATFSGFTANTPSAPGHVFKTTNTGATWTNVSGNLPDTPVNAIAVDHRTTPETLYAGTDVGVFSSSDGGTSWENVSSNADNGSGGLPNAVVTDLLIDPTANKLVAATHGRGAFTSTLPAPPVAAPTLTSFAPASGAAGTSVTLTGTNLTAATAVTFGGTAATTFAVTSATQATATVPAGATSGAIAITTPGGTATSATSFTVTVPPAAPTITDFSPTHGLVGASVTITGTGLGGTTGVSFHGTSATSFTFDGSTQVTATVPAGATAGTISVTAAGGTASSATSFTVDAPAPAAPTIGGFAPASGAPGLDVVISGANLAGATAVTFNGASATYTVDSAAQITAAVPADATSGKIAVTTAGGTALSAGDFTVQVANANAPTVTGFDPSSGPVGQTVTITGTNFVDGASVTFGGTAASTVLVVSPVEIRTSVPAGATTGHVHVTTADGTGTSAGTFTVTTVVPSISAFSPSSGVVGTSVTIDGSGFQNTQHVRFNGVDVDSYAASGTQITTTVPGGATSGPISVIGLDGSNTSTTSFTVIPGAPAVTGFAPASGPVGATVTVTGSNLAGPTGVTFGGTSATSFSADSATQVTATVPAGAATGPIAVTTAGGTATSAADFTVTIPAPTLSGFSPTSGHVGATVTISGADLSGATDVSFAGSAALFTVASPAQITATVPFGAASGTLSVTTAGGTATSAASFTVLPPAPVVSGFSPASGGVGAVVAISGSGFTGATAVSFHGTSATFTVDSDAQISATVPAGATTGPIAVTGPGGAGASTAGYTVVPNPTVRSFTPLAAAAGAVVTIYGTSFTRTSQVAFGAVPAAAVTYVSATALTAKVPAGATTGKITVSGSGASGQSTTSFKVVPKVTGYSPAVAPVGSAVTIAGSGFEAGATVVRFNGVVDATATVDSPTQISAHVPVGATSGPVGVVTTGGTGIGAAFKVTATVVSATPTIGPSGTPVVVTGMTFAGTIAVKFNGVAALFTVLSSTSIRATVPAGATTGPISVTTFAGTVPGPTFTVTPKVTGFTPLAAVVGSTVTVTGNAFAGATAVLFGGVLTAPVTVTATSLTVVVPADAATGQITVVTPAGAGSSLGTFRVLPKIAALAPAAGVAGTDVVLTGTSLGGATAVKLNGVAATFTQDSPTQITAQVPPAATSGKLSVTTAGGTALSATSFLVRPAISGLSTTSATTGTLVTITGTTFGGTMSVKFNGVAAVFLVASPTTIRATVPAAATSGTVTVTTAAGTAASPSPFTVLPKVTGFSPLAGAAGALVTVVGSGFTPSSAVTFNGLPAATTTYVGPTQVKATVPPGATTGTIAVDGALSATSFTVTFTITGLSPGEGAPGDTVTITGVGFTGTTQVLFGGVATTVPPIVTATQIVATVPAGATTGPVTVRKGLVSTTSADSFTIL